MEKNGFTVLVVDDNTGLTANLKDILEGEGYPAIVANNGESALSLAGGNGYDLALVDIKLPDMSGAELIDRLASLSPDAEYIIITGYASLDGAIRAVNQRNIVGYLTKPLNMDHLLVLIGQVAGRRRLKEALRDSEERLRYMFESVAEGITITDLEGNIVMLNDAVLRMHGYESKEELIGVSAFDLIAERDRERAMESLKRTLESGNVKDLEYAFCKKDGTEFPAELSAAILKNASGEAEGFIAVTEDISERRRTEAKIRQAAREWKETFDSITDMISIQDRDFRIVRVNKAMAELFGMNPRDVIGKRCYELAGNRNGGNCYEILDTGGEAIAVCPHEVALTGEKVRAAEIYDSSLGMYLEVSTSPMLDDDGEVTGSVRVMRDITERKKMQERLILTDRLASIGELASGIAHEMNNPLTGVVGFSEMLKERDLPEEAREEVEIIHREARRTAEIVKNLLTFARKHPPQKQLVGVNSIIEKVLELRSYEQQVNGIRVTTSFASDLPDTMVDYFQLQQVFINIVINAEYFMVDANGGGNLAIATEAADNTIRIRFTDDGPGIAPEALGHIFDPFFTTKPVGKGTGLGMSICHGMVSEHGGKLYVDSEPGKGATFTVEIPVVTTEEKGE